MSTDGDLRFSGHGWKDGQEFQLAEMVTIGNKEIRRETAAHRASAAHSQNEYRERFEQIYEA